MGWRMAHHLRGIPRSGDRLRRNRGSEFHHPGGFCGAAFAGGYGAGRGGHRCGRGALPSHAIDGRGGSGGGGDHSLQPHLSGPRDRADGGRGGIARAFAHDGPNRLLRCESQEEGCMSIERYLRLIAGFFVMASVAMGYWVNPNWFLFTAFVGLNLFQSAFTKWCPMITILRKLGVPSA